jgi:hypothetical protein
VWWLRASAEGNIAILEERGKKKTKKSALHKVSTALLNSRATTPKKKVGRSTDNKNKTTCLEKAQYTKPERRGMYVLHATVEWRKMRQRWHAMVFARDGTIFLVLNYSLANSMH